MELLRLSREIVDNRHRLLDPLKIKDYAVRMSDFVEQNSDLQSLGALFFSGGVITFPPTTAILCWWSMNSRLKTSGVFRLWSTSPGVS